MSGASLRAQPLLLSLRQVAAEVGQCRACELANLLPAANPIQPSNVGAARIVLIGQAPGAVTDRCGFHFAGPAGAVLESWFERAGFPVGYFRQHVYLTALTRCFPGKAVGGKGDRAPSRPEVALCAPFLDRELELLDPPLVLLVGRMAIDRFLGPHALHQTVGRLFELDGRSWLPLPHASGVSRWLNEPAHRELLDRAIGALSELKDSLGLCDRLAKPDQLPRPDIAARTGERTFRHG